MILLSAPIFSVTTQQTLASIIGAIFTVPPDIISSQLPMIEPIPFSLEEFQHRRRIDKIISTTWPKEAGYNNDNENYDNELLSVDEKIKLSSSLSTLLSSLLMNEEDNYNDTYDAENKAYTYGEITALGTRQLFHVMGLLKDHKNNDDEVLFYDLGSGVGKLLVQAYIEVPKLTKGVGIELIPTRHDIAKRAWENIGNKDEDVSSSSSIAFDLRNETLRIVCNNNNNNNSGIDNNPCSLEFWKKDFFQVDLSEATHIYVASLCFTEDMMKQLEEKLATTETRNLVVVATLQKFPRSTNLFLEPLIEYIDMSWTATTSSIFGGRRRGCAVYFYYTK